MVSHLYIIGNGFDIHHDIPSQYYNRKGGGCFRKWLEENDCETLCKIDDNFGCQLEEWWVKFEENLASIETLQVAYQEAFEHYPVFGSDDFHDRDWEEAGIAVELRLNEVYSNISDALRKWIIQLPPGNNKKKIRIDMENTIFLSFNYTRTLEDLYGIPYDKILHIHGCVDNESLVFGHGEQYSTLQKKMEKFERVEEGDVVYQSAKDSALYGVSAHRKKVEEIMNDQQNWFEKLQGITHIHILGHSLGDVDLPYFYKIFESCNKNNVFVEYSCRNKKESDRAASIVQSASIPLSHFRPIDMRSLQILKERYLE